MAGAVIFSTMTDTMMSCTGIEALAVRKESPVKDGYNASLSAMSKSSGVYIYRYGTAMPLVLAPKWV